MGFNFLTLLSQFNEFKKIISGQDPAALLDNEIKKRGLTKQQFNELLDQARQISKYLGLK